MPSGTILGNKLLLPQFTVSRTMVAYSQAQSFKAQPKERMAAISFKNVGTVDATVNGLELKAGDPMMTFDGDLGMIDNTTYELKFAATGGKVEVTRTLIDDIRLISVEIPLVQPAR